MSAEATPAEAGAKADEAAAAAAAAGAGASDAAAAAEGGTPEGGSDSGSDAAAADAGAADAAGADAAAAGEAQADAVADLQAQVEELKGKVKEASDARMRMLAEMENVRAIARRDVENARTYAAQKFAKDLLSVGDNLERAVASASEAEKAGSLYEGVAMTEQELLKVFANHGVEKFGAVGDAFDANKHEVVFEAPVPDLAGNSVSHVLKSGWTFKDRVLRPAQVGTTPPDS